MSAGDLLDAKEHTVPVLGSQGDRLENEQIEGAGQ
jgi:hypothetical protein